MDTQTISRSTWMTQSLITEARRRLRECPNADARDEGLACLRNAKPEYLTNLIETNHPDRAAAVDWIISYK